jgi:NADPH2:quinone reductase
MRAARVEVCGGADAIAFVDLPTPEPGPGQARVRVEAAGVNFIDVYQRSGLYKVPLPVPLGSEGAGVVEAVASDVRDLRPGMRVAWAGVAGSYATHVIAPVDKLILVPDGVDAKRAAAVMLQGMTAHYLVRSTYPLRAGETCLLHAAAGGVGLLVCQLARSIGAHVIGTASTDAKARLAREAGARDVIRYRDTDFEAEVRRITRGAGVDVVYDSVGKDTFDKSLACLRPRGMLVSFGQSSGAVAPFDPLLLSQRGSLFLTRPKLGDYTATRAELVSRATDVLEAVGRGDLAVRIHEALPLARAADAHRLLESRATAGKLILVA